MKAAVVRQHGEVDRITIETDFPEPQAGEGEVVVDVRACSLNYHDLFTLRGMPGIKVPLPIVMGIDIAGVVGDVGPGVGGWKPGDRVLVDPINRNTGKLQGEMVNGGLAEKTRVEAHQLLPLPDDLDFELAASLPVAYGTAYRMMVTRGAVAAGEKVLILGASGGVGTCCVQLAKMAGAEVAVCASSQAKLDRLSALGADHLINYAKGDFRRQTHEIFGKPRVWGGGGVDVVVNFTGGDTWVPSLRCLTKGGRLLTCGATAGFDPKTDIRFIWTFEQNIMGSNGWLPEDLVELMELTRTGKIEPVIDRVVPLEGVAEALAAMDRREITGKIVIKP
jgi:alcohol dehydrogenase